MRLGGGRARARPRRRPDCRRGRSTAAEASARPTTTTGTTARVIRLGSLAGYPFEGPRVLGGLDAARRSPAVYAIMYRPEPETPARPVRRHLRRPLRRPVGRAVPVPPPARRVLDRARRRPVEGATSARYEVPGGLRSHREQIARELAAVYRPGCNEQQYERRGRTSGSASTTRRPTGPLDHRAARDPHVATRPRPDALSSGSASRSRRRQWPRRRRVASAVAGRVVADALGAAATAPARRGRGRAAARRGRPPAAVRSHRRRCPRPCRRAAAARRRRRRRCG